ncbi:hypothetical protein DID75_03395 [Candidatus Marinamargulisbacteria bacterium SCGC AG-410-N11]|nr:hypothetical protein DID75_03395 [Candidatus Marinamargulisbacteria bacterium SCGC AG-410-N11]
MKIIDKYIFKELIGPFLFGIAAFTFILAGTTLLFNLIGESIKYNIPILDLIILFSLKLPQIIAISFPMSILFSTISVFGRMGNDLELIAFRSSGISLIRVTIPVIIFGLIISLLTIGFNESIVPKASSMAEDLFRSYRHSEKPTIKENINFTQYKDGIPIRIINVKDIKEGILNEITVAEFENGSLHRIIRSKTGKWKKLTGWEFYNGIMHYFPKNEQKKLTVINFEKEFIKININPIDLTKRKKNYEEMSRKELMNQILNKIRNGENPSKDIMNYHLKLSIAFSSLIYSIIGISVGVKPHRSSSAMGLGLSLIIILVYFILLSISMGLGLSNTMSPLFAAWIPNIIVGLTGILLLKKNSSL